MTRRVVRYGAWALPVVFLAGIGLVARGQNQTGASTSGKSLEDLLKEAQVAYTSQQIQSGTRYMIYVTLGEETSRIFAYESTIGDFKLATFFTPLVQLPQNFKPSPSLMQKLVEIDSRIPIGVVGVASDNIYYQTSGWLRTLDADAVKLQLTLEAAVREKLAPEVKPFVQEQ